MTQSPQPQDDEALLPCPFCGANPRSGYATSAAFEMDECRYAFVECCIVYSHADDLSAAISAWNRRTPAAKLDDEALVRRARELLAATFKGVEWQVTRDLLLDMSIPQLGRIETERAIRAIVSALGEGRAELVRIERENREGWKQAAYWRQVAEKRGVVIASLGYAPGRIDKESPERIWLQINTDGDVEERDDSWPGADGVTWQDESVGGLEVQYVRADLVLAASGAMGGGAKPAAQVHGHYTDQHGKKWEF